MRPQRIRRWLERSPLKLGLCISGILLLGLLVQEYVLHLWLPFEMGASSPRRAFAQCAGRALVAAQWFVPATVSAADTGYRADKGLATHPVERDRRRPTAPTIRG
jgi:hypothetical protein